MPLTEAEELELLELEEAEAAGEAAPSEQSTSIEQKSWTDTAIDAIPAAGTVAGSVLGSFAAPVAGTIAGGAAGNMVGNDLKDIIKDYMGKKSRPIQEGVARATEVAGNAARGAGDAALGLATGKAFSLGGKALGAGAEKFATSPVFNKISDATNLGGGAVGRVGSYSLPGVKYVQGVSDAAKGVSYLQKGVAYALDHAPESLGKYATVLKQAASQGPAAFATTDFLLSQKDPEYQKIKKNMHE
jgi:hypothetical protein